MIRQLLTQHRHLLLLIGLFLGAILFGISSSLTSTGTAPEDDRWIDDTYAPFDTLATDIHDYTWPTTASRAITSEFGDFRRTHFHGGIDISTNGRTGYRVLASRDGYVSRIFVSPYGYGKMLEVTHPDGFITLYGHLSRFNDELDRAARAAQYRHGSYAIDLRPKPHAFPVKKGSVIAYSGDTGIGAPHLHFEIMDPVRNAVNPLCMPSLAAEVADRRAPEPRSVSIAPLDFRATVDNDHRPTRYVARAVGGNRYRIPRVIHVRGPFSVSLEAYDYNDRTWHRTGVYAVSMTLDDSLLFTSRMQHLPSGAGRQVSLFFDWPRILDGEGRFEHLFVDLGNRLPLYDRLPELSGLINTADFAEGSHHLSVECSDPFGNRSRLGVELYFEHEAARNIASQKLAPTDDSAEQGETVLARNRGGGPRFNDGGFRADERKARSLTDRVIPMTKHSTATSLRIESKFFSDYLYIRLTTHLPITLRPSLWIRSGGSRSLIDIDLLDDRTYVGTFPLTGFSGNELSIEATADINGTDVLASEQIAVVAVSPEEGGLVTTADGRFSIEFPPDGLYRTLYCRIEKSEFGYDVYPNDVLLKKPATVRYRVPDDAPPGRTGLFLLDDGDFSLLGRHIDSVSHSITGRASRMLGSFSVLSDVTPPHLTTPSVHYRSGNLSFRAHVSDERSGVNARSIRATIDGRLVIAEYNPYAKLIFLHEAISLAGGAHELTITVSDRMGNVVTKSRWFSVLSGR